MAETITPNMLPELAAAGITDTTKVYVVAENMQASQSKTQRVAIQSIVEKVPASFGVGGSGVLEFATLAALRATTSSVTGAAKRCFVRDFSVAGDTGGGDFYLITTITYDSTYDDNSMHVVDASGRLWARVYDTILPQYFGVSIVATHAAAEAMADQSAAVQKFVDFCTDPFCLGHTRQGVGGFKGFAQRPVVDQWGRPASSDPGYARVDTAIRWEAYEPLNSSATTIQFMPGEFLPKMVLYVRAADAPRNAWWLRGERVTTSVLLRSCKGTTNVSGINRAKWATRSFTQTTTACKYPQRLRKADTYYPWTASQAVKRGEMIEALQADGSRILYEAEADHTLGGSAPTHTTGVTANLRCIGTITTPTVSGGGQFDGSTILRDEMDCGTIVEMLAHSRNAHITIDSENFCVNCMVRPKPDFYMMMYSNLYVQNGYGCKFQCVAMGRPSADPNTGFINDVDLFIAGAFPYWSGSDPRYPDTESIYSFVSSVEGTSPSYFYNNNAIRVQNASVENTARAAGYETAQTVWLAGQASKATCRTDDPVNYYTAVFGRGIGRYKERWPISIQIESNNIGQCEHNGGTNRVRAISDIRTQDVPQQITVDLRGSYHQGWSAVGDTARVIPSVGLGYDVGNAASGSLYDGIPFSDIRYKAASDTYDSIGNVLTGVVVDIDHYPSTSGSRAVQNISTMIWEPYGDASLAVRPYIVILDSNNLLINPQRYPSQSSNADPSCFIGAPGLTYQTAYITTSGVSNAESYSLGIPSWVTRFFVGIGGSNFTGFKLTIDGTRKVRFTTQANTQLRGVNAAPESGKYYGGASVPMRTPTATKSKWALVADGGVGASASVYYGASAVYANATAYVAGRFVCVGGSNPRALYRCVTGGTSNNATITSDTGCTWVQEFASTNVVLPADWANQ